MQWYGLEIVDAVEEVGAEELLCHVSPQDDGKVAASVVFDGVDDGFDVAFWAVRQQGVGPDDGHHAPEEPLYGVARGATDVDVRQLQQAPGADTGSGEDFSTNDAALT